MQSLGGFLVMPTPAVAAAAAVKPLGAYVTVTSIGTLHSLFPNINITSQSSTALIPFLTSSHLPHWLVQHQGIPASLLGLLATFGLPPCALCCLPASAVLPCPTTPLAASHGLPSRLFHFLHPHSGHRFHGELACAIVPEAASGHGQLSECILGEFTPSLLLGPPFLHPS